MRHLSRNWQGILIYRDLQKLYNMDSRPPACYFAGDLFSENIGEIQKKIQMVLSCDKAAGVPSC